MMIKHSKPVLFAVLTFLIDIVRSQTPVTFIAITEGTLPCTVTVQAAGWIDESKSNLFTLVGGSVTKPQDVQDNHKYDDYRIDHTNDTQFDLVIGSVNLTDVGNIECYNLADSITIASYDISVEAKVSNVTVVCGPPCENIGDSTISLVLSESCICSCEATGGFPDSLDLEWNIGSQGARDKTCDTIGFCDFKKDVTISPTEVDTILSCKVTGYTEQSIINSPDIIYTNNLEVKYVPDCIVKALKDGDTCTSVKLTCTCNSVPSERNYTFYQNDVNINESTINTITTNVEVDVNYKFTCSAANSVGQGDTSKPDPYYCSSGTTALPTTILTTVTSEGVTLTTVPTTIGPPNGTSSPQDPPDGLAGYIIAVIVIVILLVLICGGLSIYCFCMKGKSGKMLNSNYEDSGNDNVPPLYATPNKDKKSDKPVSGNGADPEIPAYGVINKTFTTDDVGADGKSTRPGTEPPAYGVVNKKKSSGPSPSPDLRNIPSEKDETV